MTESTMELLKCPVCGEDLDTDEQGKTAYCKGARRHCFDFSKSGYLNLASRGGEGDGKEAVNARRRFLEGGYYQPLSDRINNILTYIGAQRILDAGCGEGYYTNRFPNGTRVVGIDLSRNGIDAAARAAKAAQNGHRFVVASLYTMPVKEGSMDAVVNIFAPCAEDAFSKILVPGGYLILVGAGKDHLLGLKKVLYEEIHLNEERADLPKSMTLVQRERLHYSVELTCNEAIQDLFSMTPYYWRTSQNDKAKLKDLQSLSTLLDFDIFLFRKDT